MATLRRTRQTTIEAIAEGYSTRVIPMTQLWTPSAESGPFRVPGLKHRTALVVVGEAPGKHEDEQGEPFVGASGKLLRNFYIGHYGLQNHADVYLTNAVKCRPPDNRTPKPNEVEAHLPLLRDDVEQASKQHSRVVVLAVGAVATRALGFSALKEAFKMQGSVRNSIGVQRTGRKGKVLFAPLPVPEYTFFCTYHPAAILRNRGLGPALDTHIDCLLRYLTKACRPRQEARAYGSGRGKLKGGSKEQWLVAPRPPKEGRKDA